MSKMPCFIEGVTKPATAGYRAAQTVFDSAQRSAAMVRKQHPAACRSLVFVDGKEIRKDLTLRDKASPERSGYALRSVNAMLAAANDLLKFLGRSQRHMKSIKLQ